MGTASDRPRTAIALRVCAPAAALLAFLLMSALYEWGDSGLYASILRHWGILPFTFPFVDLHNLFASWECERQGFDVFRQNPCDVVARQFGYPPLWLAGSGLNLGIAATNITGWILDLSFLLSLFLLPPPRRVGELALVLGGSLSPMVVFALERANLDVMIFLLALVTGVLAVRAWPIRMLAYATAVLAGLLKFYPITLLILCARERMARLLIAALAALGAIATYLALEGSELARVPSLIASGPYDAGYIAAKNLPFALAEFLEGVSKTQAAEPSSLAFCLYALFVAIGAFVCWLVLKSGRLRATLATLTPDEHVFLVIGGALIVGCFFAGQNIPYRGIFLLFAIPGFLALSRNGGSRAVRVLGSWTSLVIVCLMWDECIKVMIRDRYIRVRLNEWWVVREVAWWWTVSVMTAVLVEFVGRSEVVRGAVAPLLRQLQRPPLGERRPTN